MSGGTYCHFRKGTAGASSQHMMYISRPSAVEDREQGVLTHNIPEEVREAHNYEELRTNLASYAWAREESEMYRDNRTDKVRTHFRVTFSFEKELEVTKAKEMTGRWLEESFPQARACGFVHKDTEHTHVHVWIDARQIDGRKVDIAPRKYRQLDERWNRIYAREFGRDEREHLAKKAETREYKRAMVRGEDGTKPLRAENQQRQEYKEREERNLGKNIYDQSRNERNQPETTERGTEFAERKPAITPGERETERFVEISRRADGEAERTLSEVSRLREDITRMDRGEPNREIDRGRER